jgi:hypothetical protein
MGKEHHRVWIRLPFIMMLGLVSGVSAATPAADIPGQYVLQVREMISHLKLEPDNSFSARIDYAGAQGAATGHWKQQGDTLILTSDAVEPPAQNLLFNLSRTRSLAELQAQHQAAAGDLLKQARDHYLLNLHYARSAPVPGIKPVTVLFEFNQGPGTQLLWNNAEGRQLYLPLDEQRHLARVGFQATADQPVQWFDVDPATRSLSVNWAVDRASGQMSYEQPEEFSLAQSRQFFRYARQDLALIEHNYILALNYGVVAEPPTIKPVDIFWVFDDGSEQQQRWTDSRQQQLQVSAVQGKALKKLGVKLAGDQAQTQWFEVAAGSRVLDLMWDERLDPARARDLSGVFKNLDLQVQGDCLAVDLGNGPVCYRK